MTIRQEMLRSASVGASLLGDARDLTVNFVQNQLHRNGGFKNRFGQRDLYYTVFGMELLSALKAEVPFTSINKFLCSFGDGSSLDFVHLICLTRCWANLEQCSLSEHMRKRILQRIETHRCADGGYRIRDGSTQGTVYGSFLVLGAYQDLNSDLPNSATLVHFLASRKTEDGGYANEQNTPSGSTPVTAAAIIILQYLAGRIDLMSVNWLLSRRHKEGGFLAVTGAPLPDLLSTATALYALAKMDVPFIDLQEPCLNFLESLWSDKGGFCGSWGDRVLDCEYTYYGLLALGHLGNL